MKPRTERHQYTAGFAQRLLRIFRGASRGAGYVEYSVILMFQRFRAIQNVKVRNQAKTVVAMDSPTPQDVIALLGGYETYTEAINDCGDICMIPGQCFAAGTLVATETGDRPIESVQVGDKVWSRGELGGALELHPVSRLFVNTSYVMDLQVGHDLLQSETLKVTPNHPFWVEGQGWTRADALAAATVWSPDGLMAATGRIESSVSTTVYNFEVEGTHTYLVGHAHVLVHNATTPPAQCPGDPGDPGSAAHKAQRWLDYLARVKEAGGTPWSYDRWSRQYDVNMRNPVEGLARQREYAEMLGGASKTVNVPGLGNRQIDVLTTGADGKKVAVEIKTGYEYLSTTGSTPNDKAIEKDKWLAENGYSVVWVLEEGASQPLKDALDAAGIKWIEGSATAAEIFAKAGSSAPPPP
jgi:hypothetical protein